MEFQVSDFSDKPVDSAELYIKITNTIKDILKRKFLTGPKTELNITTKDINFACPYCGDSQRDEDKKRGHMYHNDGSFFYACYNDGCGQKSTINQFLEHFGSKDNLSPGEFRYLKSSFDPGKIGGIGGGPSKSTGKPHSSLLFKAVREHGFDRKTLINEMRLSAAADSNACRQYLMGRKQTEDKLKFFAYNAFNKNIYILNLDEETDKVFGIQIRYDQPKMGKRFHTMTYFDLIKELMRVKHKINWSEKDVILTLATQYVRDLGMNDETVIHMNKLSLVYNITNVRFNFPIFIFESAIDSNHFTNSIAAMGTNNKVNLPNAFYVYDNSVVDNGGRDAAIDAIKERKRVFLWSKFCRQYPMYEKCKDWNDVFKKGGKFTVDDLAKFCSDDPIDMFYI